MLKGFAEAHKATGNNRYADIALKNAQFIIQKIWSPEGHLFRTYKNEKATINGYLEDYAHVIAAFISLYEITLNESWLANAKQLTDYCFDHFYDKETEFFSFTSHEEEALVTPHFEVEDNVIPAANSVMAVNLFRLSVYFNQTYYKKTAEQMLQHILPNIDYPSAFSNWLNLLLHFSDAQNELAICTEKASDYLKQLNLLYTPNLIIAGTDKASTLPFLTQRFVQNQTLFYWCHNKTCDLPTADFQEIINKIEG
jgi:uncharacterized protein YyaL (SSP411 family)